MDSAPAPCICDRRDTCRKYHDLEEFVGFYRDNVRNDKEFMIFYEGFSREAEELQEKAQQSPFYERCSPTIKNALGDLETLAKIGMNGGLTHEQRERAYRCLAAARIAIGSISSSISNRPEYEVP